MSTSGPTGIQALLVTARQSNGSYLPRTLPMWAGIFLREVEELLGPRDPSYCFLGIDFHGPNLPPRNWFPDTGIPPSSNEPSSKQIIVHLTVNTIGDPERARWQLAHECVHLIDPWNPTIEGRYTSVLEEGLATWYQCKAVSSKYLSDNNYKDARDLVLKYEPTLLDAVKNIRQKEQNASGGSVRIGDISPELLAQYCKDIDSSDADELCKTFVQ